MRHSAINGMVRAGFPIQVIERVVGTSRKQVYEAYMNVQVTVDANVGRRYVEQMTNGTEGDVPAEVPAAGSESS
jgi:intergrase/recombinase